MAAPTLGALTLPEQMIWVDQYAYSPVSGQMNRTLAGGLAIFNQGAVEGRPITLEARDGVAWLTQAQVDSLVTMAGQVAATFTLVFDGNSYDVQFSHHSPPAIDFAPLWPFDPNYTGLIKLITV